MNQEPNIPDEEPTTDKTKWLLKKKDWSKLDLIAYLATRDDSHLCQQLKINKNQIGAQGIKVIVEIDNKWPNLNELWLGQNQLGNKGLRYLSQYHWPSLKILYTGLNGIDQSGVSHLVKLEAPLLQNLSLFGNIVNGDSCMLLRKSNWENLKNIWLDNNVANNQKKYGNIVDYFGVKYLCVQEWKLIRLTLTRNNCPIYIIQSLLAIVRKAFPTIDMIRL